MPLEPGFVQWVPRADVWPPAAEEAMPEPLPGARIEWAQPIVDIEPEPGPEEPGRVWIENGEGEVMVMRTDNYGWRYVWIYLTQDEMKKLGALLMERLVKDAHAEPREG